MKNFKTMAAQGDLLLVRIAELPEKLRKIAPENGVVVVGHSETGHHHVIDADAAELYEHTKPLPDAILECFVVIGRETELRHLREFDTHEPIRLEPGIYKIRRQREHTPEGWQRAQD